MRALHKVAGFLGGVALAGTVAVPAIADVSLTGRLHLDAAFYDEDKTSIDNGVLVRRARLGVKGTFGDGFGYHMEYNFADNSLSGADQFLSYDKLGPGLLKVGNFKVPFGLNELTSSNSITFIERTLGTEAFVDARKLGVGYEYFSGPIGAQAMAYTRSLGAGDAQGDEPLGIGGRFVYNPPDPIGALITGDKPGIIHLGAAAAWQSTDSRNQVRFRARPEARAGGTPRLVDTGAIENVDSTLKLGAEVGWTAGPVWLEGEYIHTNLDRKDGFGGLDFNAWSAQTGFIFNGTRPYRGGRFRTVARTDKSAALGSAWELAARYSGVDLNDGPVAGGRQDNYTLAFNVYPSDYVRLMVNVIFVDQKDTDDSPMIFALRTQVNF